MTVFEYTKTERSTRDRNHLLKHAFDIANFEDEDVILEFGVRSGTSLAWMAQEIMRQDLQVHLYGFDSFEGGGLPEETEGVWNHPKHVAGSMSVKQSEVEKILPDDPRIVLVPGWFEETVDHHRDLLGRVKLVNIDCDMHSSTGTILEFLKPAMSHGMIIHFDDWWDHDGREPWGEKLAWMQFTECYPAIRWDVLVSCDHGRRIIEIFQEGGSA